ncbi:MAG: phosphotransferase [Ardenticatenales bacterium]|nr:phosphotransferase [Ardenticatenales bacterium]
MAERLAVLSAWFAEPVAACAPLVPDSVWRVETTDGGAYVLKERGEVALATGRSLQFELAVLDHLDAATLPIVLPTPDQHGERFTAWENHYFQLTPYVAHKPWPAPGPARLALLHHLGTEIARLHEAMARFPIEQLPENIRRNDLFGEILLRAIPLGKKQLNGPDHERFATLTAALEKPLAEIYGQLPNQLIHRDCHAGNFLCRAGQLAGIIDWDQLSLGPRLLDIAYFAVQMIKRRLEAGASLDEWPAEWAALLAGYRQRAPLTTLEETALPYLLLTIPLLFIRWCLDINRPDWAKIELQTLFWLAARFVNPTGASTRRVG